MLSDIISFLKRTQKKSEKKDTFCTIPWKGMLLTDSGVVKICCQSEWLMDDKSRPLNIYEETLEEIWNSDNMRRIRKDMVEGRFPAECAVCEKIESEGGKSPRMYENDSWLSGWISMEGVTFDDLIALAVKNDYRLPYRPIEYVLEAGNLCNLKCRSCSADRSSKVEMDPVQSIWRGKHHDIVRWRNNRAVIGPHNIIGATYDGFHGYDPRSKVRWTKGKSKLTLPASEDELEALSIRFADPMPKDHFVSIFIGGNLAYEGRPQKNGMSMILDVEGKGDGKALELVFDSPTFKLPESCREVGVGIEHIEVLRKRDRKASGSDKLLSGRFSGAKHWIREKDFIYNELLKNPKEIKHLRIVGGEPLIINEIIEITDYIIKHGEPENFSLSMSTNGTVFDQRFFENASKLKRLVLGVSLDGMHQLFEYIRFPAKWDQVTKNIERFQTVKGLFFYISITVMAYNVLDIVDLLRFCDKHMFNMYIFVLDYPDYLSIEILPPHARRVAASRLRDYGVRECRAQYKDAVMSIVCRLESQGDHIDKQRLRNFMLFTNDLDKTRNQNIKDICGELVRYMDDAGFEWTKETKYAQTS